MFRVLRFAFALAMPMSASAAYSQDGATVEVDWVQNYEGLQAANSYDYLLNCWTRQWPDGVMFSSDLADQNIATEADLESAISGTRENCEVEILVRLDQIHIDLAREGVPVSEIEGDALKRLDAELDAMFGEYWARL